MCMVALQPVGQCEICLMSNQRSEKVPTWLPKSPLYFSELYFLLLISITSVQTVEDR